MSTMKEKKWNKEKVEQGENDPGYHRQLNRVIGQSLKLA